MDSKSRMSNASTPNVDTRYRDTGDPSARNSANKSDSDTDLNDIQASQHPVPTAAATTAATAAATASTAIPHPPVTPSGHLSLRKVTIKKTDGNVPKLSLSEKLKRIEKLSSKRNVLSAGAGGRGSGGGGTVSREGRSPKYGISMNDAAYRDEEDDMNEDHFGDINIIGGDTPSPAFGENIMSGAESSRNNIDSRTNLHSNNSNRISSSTRMTTPREPQTPSNNNSNNNNNNLRKLTSSSPSEERNIGGTFIRKQLSGVDNPHRRKFMKPSLKIEVKRSTTNNDNEDNDFEVRQSRDTSEILKCPSDCISPKHQFSPMNHHNQAAMRALTAPSSPTPRSSPPLPAAAHPPVIQPSSPPRTSRRPTTTTNRPLNPIAQTQSNDNDLTAKLTNHLSFRNHPVKSDSNTNPTVVSATLPASTSTPNENIPPASIRSPRSSARGVRTESLGGGGGGWAANNNNNNNDVLAETLPINESFTPKTPSSPRVVRMHLPLRRLSSSDKPNPATPLLKKRPKTNEATRYSSNSNTVEFLRKSAVLQYGNEKSQPEEVNALKLLIQKENGYIEDMGKAISLLKNKQNKVNSDGNRMLKRIDQFFESQIINANKTRSVFDTKEYHRPELLKEKFDKWLSLEYESSKQSHLELDAKKDMQSLEEHVQRKHYRQSMENLMKASWFAPCFTKLQEVAQRNGQPIPKSCLKFLSVLQCIFMVGREFTPELFYYVMEHTVAREDHILLGVYKTLKYALDAVNITPDSFLDYLEERGIQPCAEHLANIRKLRKLGRLKLAAAGRNANIGSANVSPTGSGLGSRIRFNDIEQPRPKSKRASNLELIYEDDEPYESGESSRLSAGDNEEDDEEREIDYDT